MAYPSREKAEQLLAFGQEKNPGPWVDHSQVTARAAATIAKACGLDEGKAYALGLLHDIGRYEGPFAMHHLIAGYTLMMDKGYPAVAKVCLTHSFPIQNLNSYSGKQDCSEEELAFLAEQIETLPYDDYDRLIQLCDSICLPQGVCLLQVRLMDVLMRHGANPVLQEKWQKDFEIKRYFDEKCGQNIYDLFGDEVMRVSLSFTQ